MRTLGDLLSALFPRGTSFPEIAGLELQDGESSLQYDVSPSWPPDAFAYAGKLLDLSGAYHHVSPETLGPASRTHVRRLLVSEAERDEAVRVGRKWAGTLKRKRTPVTIPDAPAEVARLWTALRASSDTDIFVDSDVNEGAPAWWRTALQLMMIADEAAQNLGFDHDPRNLEAEPANAFEALLDTVLFVPATERRAEADNLYSWSFANQNLLAVLPKSRTPAVGCTLRSLSHNLALVPPGGEVRVRWLSPHAVEAENEARPLKLLVIPYPYEIDAECFHATGVADGAKAAPWGWFHIEPLWLGVREGKEAQRSAEEFASFVVDLVEAAGVDGVPVGAIILPEAALDELFFATLFKALLRRCPDVELLVAGTSQTPVTDKLPRPGNFVAQAVFVTSNGERQGVRTIREKHHRWRLDRGQIETYQLAAQLDPAMLWWEGIDITSRSLDMVAFRPGATMTTLICEDLARVDPCQGAVRAVGPTLLFALLMDGSQLAVRWPGRYATVLAEDPGCSVMTVSSLGLINRSRLPDGSTASRSVALWRDASSGLVQVHLQPGHHAVCMIADPVWTTECTLDGRQDGGQALTWKLRSTGDDAPRSIRAKGDVPPWIEKGVR